MITSTMHCHDSPLCVHVPARGAQHYECSCKLLPLIPTVSELHDTKGCSGTADNNTFISIYI